MNPFADPHRRGRYVAGSLLLLTTVVLYVFQYVTLDKLKVLPPSKPYGSAAVYFGAVADKVDFAFIDGLLAAVILVLCGAMLLLEIKRRWFSDLLSWGLESERRTMLLLALGSLVLIRYYFALGPMHLSGDASLHLQYSLLAARYVANGTLGIWTNQFGLGMPFVQFYGFLYYYVVAFVDFVVRDLFTTTKLVLAASHVFSGLGMYSLVRLITRSRSAALVAGVAYVLSFWHAQHVLVMGRLPLSLFYGIFPWPFYFLERTRLPHAPLSAVVVGSLCLGSLALIHPGYAFWATGFYLAHAGIRAASIVSIPRRNRLLWYAGAIAFFGVLFGSSLTVPMWMEKDLTGLAGGIDLSAARDATWRHLFVWSNLQFELWPVSDEAAHWYGGYVGLSLFLTACAGMVACFRSERRSHRILAAGISACFIFTLILVLGYRLPPLQALPIVRAFVASRFLLFVLFYMSILVGFAVLVLSRARPSAVPGPAATATVATWILIVALIDLGPTTFRHPYHAGSGGLGKFTEQIKTGELSGLEADERANYRIFVSTRTANPAHALARVHYELPIPFFRSLYPGAAHAAFRFSKPFVKVASGFTEETRNVNRLNAERPGNWLEALVGDGLFMLNVKWLLVRRGMQDEGENIMITPLRHHSPIIVSPRILVISEQELEQLAAPIRKSVVAGQGADFPGDPDTVAKLFYTIANTSVHRETGTAQQLILRGPGRSGTIDANPSVQVLEHRVWDEKVLLRVNVTEPCFARLAYAVYPYLRVIVDGEAAQPRETVGGFIALSLSAGEHEIRLEPFLSPLRKALFGLDLMLLAAGAGIVVWEYRRRTQTVQRVSVQSK